MSFCPYCGKELSAEENGAKFCAYCGKPLNAEEPVTEEAPVAEETPVVEEAPATEGTPAPEKKINIDVEAIKAKLIELKDKAVALCNTIVEKLKTVPALAGIIEKIDQKFYPAIVAAPVALVLLILVLVIGIFSSGSYMTPINDALNAINKKQTDFQKVVYSVTPDYREGLLKDAFAKLSKADKYDDYVDDAKENLEEIYEKIDDEFKSWKITFAEKSHKKVDKDDLEDYQDQLDDIFDDNYEDIVDNCQETLEDDDDLESFADSLDMSENDAKRLLKSMVKYYNSFDKMKVSEVYEVKGKFVIKADKEEWESETVKIFVAKVNGSWVIVDVDGSIEFEDDDEELDLFRDCFSVFNYDYTSYDLFYILLMGMSIG